MPYGDGELNLPMYMRPKRGRPEKAAPAAPQPSAAPRQSRGAQSAKPQSAKAQSAKPQSVKAQSAKPQDTRTQLTKAQPAKTQPVKGGAAKARATGGERPARTQAAQQAVQQQTAAARTAPRRRAIQKAQTAQGAARGGKRRGGMLRGRLTIVAAAFLILLCGSIWFVGLSGAGGPSTVQGMEEKLPEGLRMLGVEVGGERISAARARVETEAAALLQNAAVTLSMDGESYTLHAADMGLKTDLDGALRRAMQYDPEGGRGTVDVTTGEAADNITNVFTWDGDALAASLAHIAADFDRAATEPAVRAVKEADGSVSFAFDEGVDGRRFDAEGSLQELERRLGAGELRFDVDGLFQTVPPTLSAAALRDGFGLRASYSTDFDNDPNDETIQNRVFNIEKAADMINGTSIAPGEEWSFNDFVGVRSYDTGWKGANGIADGKEYTIQAGGGICQVSTTLYNALLCADVEITDRRAHSIPSSYVPRGLDATVDSITDIDLKFRNDTDSPIYLCATVDVNPEDDDEKTITFYIYGKELEPGVSYKTRSEVIEYIHNKDVHYTDDNTIPRGYKLVTVEARRGYVVEAYRDRYRNGVLESSELLYTDNYKGNHEEAQRGTASPKYYEPPAGAVPIGD